MNEKIWKIDYLWILVSSLTMTGEVKAACTPTPDCASIGYTETSCEGDSLKCPFDISKLFCVPCDSSFKYDCSGANITGGIGTSCGGKYMSCTCSNGRTFANGVCEETAVAQNCTVGMIYYSDKSCSEDVDASKTAIGVVVKDNELVMSQRTADYMMWSYDLIDVSGITNITSEEVAKTDYNGKANTLAIVSAYSGESASDNAAIYCNSYSTAGTSAGDWYLPAAGELYDYFYGGGINYSKISATWTKLGITVDDDYFWSSSDHSYLGAWFVTSSSGIVDHDDKTFGKSVSCLLAIN